jgi:glycerol uptake facilitator-like aquaporin
VADELPRKALAEFVGTALLLIAVIGSGICAAVAVLVIRVLYPGVAEAAPDVVVPHEEAAQ